MNGALYYIGTLSEVCGVRERWRERGRARVFGHQPHVKPHAPLSQYDADIEPTEQTDLWTMALIISSFNSIHSEYIQSSHCYEPGVA